MTSINQNDSLYANNVRTMEFTVVNKDVTPNVPYNLTGMTARWSMSRQYDDGGYSSTPMVTKTMGSGIVINVDPTTGKLTVTLLPADTLKLLGKFHHELEIINGSGQGLVVATGTLTILRNIGN